MFRLQGGPVPVIFAPGLKPQYLLGCHPFVLNSGWREKGTTYKTSGDADVCGHYC